MMRRDSLESIRSASIGLFRVTPLIIKYFKIYFNISRFAIYKEGGKQQEMRERQRGTSGRERVCDSVTPSVNTSLRVRYTRKYL